jgi:hypothetical protein
MVDWCVREVIRLWAKIGLATMKIYFLRCTIFTLWLAA